MNRKQRRIQHAQQTDALSIRIGQRDFSIEEADALAARYSQAGDRKAALHIYTQMRAKLPRHPEVHNAHGLTLQAMKRPSEALESYAKAIALRPDYAEAYNNRALALQELQRYGEALENYDKAISLMPERAEIHLNRAVTLSHLKRDAEALAASDKAITLQLDFTEAHLHRGLCLHRLRRLKEALESYGTALRYNPAYAEAYNNQGLTLQELKRFDEALLSYDKAIEHKPDYAEAHHHRGQVLVVLGRMEEAASMFLQAHALKPEYAHALLGLTGIRTYGTPHHPEVAAIQSLLHKRDMSEPSKEVLYFALGKVYDDCGLYGEAFECYQEANRIGNARVAYDRAGVKSLTDEIITVFTGDFLSQRHTYASPSRMPLFIVGMPRSGTTLMASILSNHPKIGMAGELGAFPEFAARLPESTGTPSYPEAAEHMPLEMAGRMKEEYEGQLRRGQPSGISHIIDKQPLNFRHLGLIAMLYPHATVIHCTRHPLDTALSNYFQRFSAEYDYAYDLGNIAHFYGQYEKLMRHWRAQLPLKLIEVRYEDMVLDIESLARRVLESLGLEWDGRCTLPHTNPHAVETASNWQVRQPVYSRSVGRWKHYAEYMQAFRMRMED